MVALITADDVERLMSSRGVVVREGKASLAVTKVDGPNEPEERFLMLGPSGRHSLLVIATDVDRLNAHWSVFASDPRNQGD